MSKQDYTRCNVNIKNNILEIIDTYTGNSSYGRSALVNFLLASALSNRAVVEALDKRCKARNEEDQ